MAERSEVNGDEVRTGKIEEHAVRKVGVWKSARFPSLHLYVRVQHATPLERSEFRSQPIHPTMLPSSGRGSRDVHFDRQP